MNSDRELHYFVTKRERFRILQSILDHTEQLPRECEISQFCPEMTAGDVADSLEELVAKDIVRPVTLS